MFSYRHGFHAGHHADVFKHSLLTLLIRSLLAKEKPIFYLDTHAGAGRYNLDSQMARKNREYETGVSRLWHAEDIPEVLNGFMAVLRLSNPSGGLRWYPGSPRVVGPMLRPKDRMVLCELHPNEVRNLSAEFANDRQVRVEHLDGYAAMKALLPPIERRGLVHIDPAFELKGEWRRLLEAIEEGYKRWATGIFAIWYPLQDRYESDEFLRRLQRSGIRKILLAELSIFDPADTLRLTGSGMAVINPPWHLEEQLKTLLPWLWNRLSIDGEGKWRVEWLVEE